MDETTHRDFPVTLSRAQRKLEHWRRQHGRGARIAEELWAEAVELASEHGVNRIARALRLDYYSLKKRLPAAARSGRHRAEFVELLPGGMPAAGPECMIELEDGGGAKMRIRLLGGNLPDLAALTRAFRESGQ